METEKDQDKQLADAKELLDILETPGGKRLIELIEKTIEAIPCDVVDFVGASANGMSVDTTRVAFSAGGKTYLKEVLHRIEEVKEFVKRVAVEKETVKKT